MNLLHSIKALNDDTSVNVIIEIPTGSRDKTEYDKDQEKFIVDRVLNSKIEFPFNYGFVPETWSEDDDPLDIAVISSRPIPTGQQVKTRIIGMLATIDQEGPDSKLISIPISETDPIISKIDDVGSLQKQMLDTIQSFYKNYKINEPGKWVDIDGVLPKERAEIILSEAIQRYHQHFQK